MEINRQLLQSLLIYEPETGKLFWKERPSSMFKNGRRSATIMSKTWNSRYAGKEAFTAKMKIGYKIGSIGDKRYLAHRIIWALVFDEWPEQIDHINGDRTDNRLDNLRPVNNAENHRNMGVSKANTSGTTGVFWVQRISRWNATIKKNFKAYSLGSFADKEEAIKARKEAEVEFGFHKNHASRPSFAT